MSVAQDLSALVETTALVLRRGTLAALVSFVVVALVSAAVVAFWFVATGRFPHLPLIYLGGAGTTVYGMTKTTVRSELAGGGLTLFVLAAFLRALSPLVSLPQPYASVVAFTAVALSWFLSAALAAAGYGLLAGRVQGEP
jgi:hypothetical protein